MPTCNSAFAACAQSGYMSDIIRATTTITTSTTSTTTTCLNLSLELWPQTLF